MCKSAHLFMPRAKFFKHELRGGERFDRVLVRGGDVLADKSAKDSIISVPDIMSIASRRDVGAGERTIKPVVNAIGQRKDVELATPFDPVGFAKIKNEVRGPVTVVQDNELKFMPVGAVITFKEEAR